MALQKAVILFSFLPSNNLPFIGKCGLTHFSLNHSINISNCSVLGTGNSLMKGMQFVNNEDHHRMEVLKHQSLHGLISNVELLFYKFYQGKH